MNKLTTSKTAPEPTIRQFDGMRQIFGGVECIYCGSYLNINHLAKASSKYEASEVVAVTRCFSHPLAFELRLMGDFTLQTASVKLPKKIYVEVLCSDGCDCEGDYFYDD